MSELVQSFWSAGLGGYAALVLAFVTIEMLPVPRTPLVIAAGAVFGVAGAPAIVVASTIGGVTVFLLARSVLQRPARRLLRRYALSEALLRSIDVEGVRLLALLRFCSPVPSVVQNVAFGLTRLRLWPYAAVTLLASVPQITLYCYLGAIGRQAARGDLGDTLSLGLLALALASFGTALVIIRRRLGTLLAH